MSPPAILIVDHDPFFRDFCRELLAAENYQCHTAATGEEALAVLSRTRVDLLLADLQLPGCDGLELLRQTSTLEPPPDVILTTSEAPHETTIEALKSGARDYLAKPCKPEELLHLIKKCVDQRRLLDENSLLKGQIRLYQRGQTIAALIEVDQLLPLAVTTLLNEIRQGCGLAFLSSGEKILSVYGTDGLDETAARDVAQLLLPTLGRQQSMHIVQGADLPARTTGTTSWIKTACLIPLRCERDIKGGIILTNPREGDFTTSLPLDNLNFLAEQTALGFDNAFRYQGARDLIYTDDLTGLYNYRYLQLMLEQEIKRTERYGLSFSLLFIDLDHFKEVNDTYGHLSGSQVLRELGDLLKGNVREVDILFRYGGDEFTALLIETDSRGAATVAERIRKAIEGMTFQAVTGEPVKITATLGYSSFPESGKDKDAILDLADRAMYEGKKQRNVVRGAWELECG